MPRICVIPGDGIGPEVMTATLEALSALDLKYDFEMTNVGIEHHRETGMYISSETFEMAESSDAILFGTLTTPNDRNYVSPLLLLRWNLELFANVRPVRCINPDFCIAPGFDMVVIRENTEGLYGGIEREMDDRIITERTITRAACKRIVDFSFKYALANKRKKVSCVHKANVLRTSDEMFRTTFYGAAVNYAFYNKIRSDDCLVDTAAMNIIRHPENFDVIVTLNLYGDILSDEAAGMVGGLGFAPSGNMGSKHAMFEPVHGSAPDIAGRGIANPTACLLSAAMMMRHLGDVEKAKKLDSALTSMFADRANWTKDVGGECTTREFTARLIKKLDE